MIKPMRYRGRLGRSGAVWLLAALLLVACSSEADQSPAQSRTTTTLAASPAPPAATTAAPPAAAPPAPAEDESDTAQLLAKAAKSLEQGQESQALEQVDSAARLLWQRLPLALAQALLVAEPAKGYGVYQPRPDEVYLVASPERPVFPGKGQPMYIYLEPVYYGLKEMTDGRHQISFAMDVELYDGQDKQLLTKRDFMRVDTLSHRFKREFFINVTIDLKGAPPGAYKLRLILKDLIKGQQAQADLPVKLALAPLEKDPPPEPEGAAGTTPAAAN